MFSPLLTTGTIKVNIRICRTGLPYLSLKPHKKCNKLNKMKYEPKKVIEIPEIEFNRVVAGQYKASVINPDGSVEREGNWNKNLILDCGLDKIAYMPWAQVFQFCVAGDQLSGSVTPASVFDTQLEKPAMMNSFYLPGSGNCGSDIYSSGDDRYLKLFRTFDFLAQKQNTVITELGFKVGDTFVLNQEELFLIDDEKKKYH